MKKQRIFIIGGPTASGKSAFALRLADEIHGQIVNGDAIQVYRDLRILSARPSLEDEQRVPHFLFGDVDAWTTPTMIDWLKKAADLLPTLSAPIVVGGTGMYLDALINGVNELPEIPDEIRKKIRQMPLEDVKKQIKDCPFSDPQRLRRWLEVQLTTGYTPAYFHQHPKKKYLQADFVEIHLLPARERVYENCAIRFDSMKKQGVIQEVVDLMEKKPTGGVLKAIGVCEINDFLNGTLTEEEMSKQIITKTRQYAKRQMTWFRHHGVPKLIITDPKTQNLKNITK